MKSLKTKMMVYLVALLLVVCSGLSTISYVIAARALEEKAKNSLVELARQGAKVVQSRIEDQLNALEIIASMNEIYDSSTPIEEKLAILKREAERRGHIRMGIADLK